MTRKEITDKVGLFDGDFVSYMEESDYCFRVWLLGYKVIYFPKTHILHKVGFSYSKISPIVVNYNSFKNRILSLYKNLETKNLFLILIPHTILILILAFYYLLSLQFSKSGMIIRSIIWNVMNVKKTYIKRQKIQKMRLVSDNEIFKYVMKEFNLTEMFKHFLKVEANYKK